VEADLTETWKNSTSKEDREETWFKINVLKSVKQQLLSKVAHKITVIHNYQLGVEQDG